jgi:NADPH-dependent 2,4-dienoyl-CoA reductase/sulfur reductase-like enzyme
MDKADFIDMGRGSVADPYLPKKAKEGKFKEINYCIGCLQGCENGLFNPGTFTCLVNPRVTREYEEDLSKKEVSKNVMIIGAGPAGMMAARTAAMKGHTVTVYDKDTHFGGAFRSAAYPMGKGELTTVISSYREQCINLGVKFNMGVEVNENIIKQEHSDAIIIATGSRPFAPNIPGTNNINVFTAEDVLYGNVNIPVGPVVVCGGGEVGCETAEFISQTNRDVTVIEMKNQILTDMILQNMLALVDRMKSQQIRVLTDSAVQSINDDSVTYKDISGKMNTIPATTIISAFGYKAYNPLEEVAKANCSEVYVVGSAVKVGNALTATSEGYKAALKL